MGVERQPGLAWESGSVLRCLCLCGSSLSKPGQRASKAMLGAVNQVVRCPPRLVEHLYSSLGILVQVSEGSRSVYQAKIRSLTKSQLM